MNRAHSLTSAPDCDAMRIQIGRHSDDEGLEHANDYHLIAVPAVGASAVVSHRDALGDFHQSLVSDRHVSIIPAGRVHKVVWAVDAQRTNIMITPKFLDQLAFINDIRGFEMMAQISSVDPLIWHVARAVEQQMHSRPRLGKSYVDSIAVVIGQHLLCTYAEAPSHVTGHSRLPLYKVRRAIDYIHAHFREEISFKDIADHLGMSPFHFARMFKRSTNDSPHQFITRCRVDAAKHLLLESDRSIAEIALEVGYKNQSHFTTRFASLAGITPAAFRMSP